MVVSSDPVDAVFSALGDPTRRDIVVRVLRREWTVSELSQRYDMSFAAVQKHVAVLERANLVSKRRAGREAWVSGNVDTLRRATELLHRMEAIWRARFQQMGDVIASLDPQDDP